MSIKDIEYYYGAVFFRLIGSGIVKSMEPLNRYKSKGIYLLNKIIPIYIKYSTKRLSPWSFSLSREHQDDFMRLKKEYGTAFMIFVCGIDGICSIEFDEFKNILDHVHEEVEWVRIARSKKESYRIKGKDGELKHKISDSDFPRSIIRRIESNNLTPNSQEKVK